MIRICLFVEDVAQENLVRGLVLRLAAMEGAAVDVLVLNAEGGEGRVRTSLKRYLADLRRNVVAADLLIVAVDANNVGASARRAAVVGMVADRLPVAVATPVPYIESWYIADAAALGRVLGHSVSISTPSRRTRRHLKATLREAVISAVGQRPALGGAEYGGAIASTMDLDATGRQEGELASFCADVRSALRLLLLLPGHRGI